MGSFIQFKARLCQVTEVTDTWE